MSIKLTQPLQHNRIKVAQKIFLTDYGSQILLLFVIKQKHIEKTAKQLAINKIRTDATTIVPSELAGATKSGIEQ